MVSSSKDGVVTGVTAQTPQGPLEIRAALTIGADGRHSIVREKAGFTPRRHRRADGRALVQAHASRQATLRSCSAASPPESFW